MRQNNILRVKEIYANIASFLSLLVILFTLLITLQFWKGYAFLRNTEADINAGISENTLFVVREPKDEIPAGYRIVLSETNDSGKTTTYIRKIEEQIEEGYILDNPFGEEPVISVTKESVTGYVAMVVPGFGFLADIDTRQIAILDLSVTVLDIVIIMLLSIGLKRNTKRQSAYSEGRRKIEYA